MGTLLEALNVAYRDFRYVIPDPVANVDVRDPPTRSTLETDTGIDQQPPLHAV